MKRQNKLVKMSQYLLIALVLLTGSANAIGEIYTWGANEFGQLGDGSTTGRLTPAQVNGLADATIVKTSSYHSLALKSDGTVWAWGWNIVGQLGDGSTTDRLTPVQVNGLTGVAGVAAGKAHSLAVKSDGTVWTWGENAYGQLGIGNYDYGLHSTPVQVNGLAGVVAVAGGYDHSLALKSDGTVWAWGWNSLGELGIGENPPGYTSPSYIPVQVSGLSNIIAIAAPAGQRSFALKSDGTVWAWGSNYFGQLGDGTTTTRLTPVQVSGLSNVVAIAASGGHSLALKSDGTVWAWGFNARGQLGDGTTTTRLTPVQVSGLSNVVAIAGGLHHSLALKLDGTVWSWGLNEDGQLGDGSITDRLIPVQVDGLVGATAVAAGYIHSLALSSFNFNLAVTPQSQTLRPGGNAIFIIDTILLGGTAQNVDLSVTVKNAATNQPEDSIITSVSPSSILLTKSTTVFVGTNSNTPIGTYNVMVTGTSGTIQKTVTASIIVSGQPLPNNPIGLSSYTVKMVTGAPLADQIKVPTTGSFVVVLTSGSTFSVIDNDATDELALAKVQIVDNKIYKLYERATGGKSGASMDVFSPFILGVLMPQSLTLSKTSPPTTIDLTSLSPYILQIPVPASIVDSSKSWVSPYYPSNGLPYKFTNNNVQEAQLIFILQ